MIDIKHISLIALMLILNVIYVDAQTQSFETDQLYMTRVAWSHDGSKIAVGGIMPNLRRGYFAVFQANTNQLLYELDDASLAGITALAWSPDNRRVAVGSFDYRIFVIDSERWQLITQLNGHTGTITSLDWSPDGTQLASSGTWDQQVIIWDMSWRVVRFSCFFSRRSLFSAGAVSTLPSILGFRCLEP
jgi:WD40 repeat protein